MWVDHGLGNFIVSHATAYDKIDQCKWHLYLNDIDKIRQEYGNQIYQNTMWIGA